MRSRRDEIARVAAGVIADSGLEHASMREIASRMGVTTGTITHQFRNRDDLLRATFEVTVAAVRRRADRASHGLRGRDLLATVLSQGLPTTDEGRVEAAVWLAFSISATTSAEHARLCGDLYAEWERSIAALLVEIGLPAARAHDGARVLIAAADGIALRAMAGPAMAAAEQRRLLDAAIAGVVGTR